VRSGCGTSCGNFHSHCGEVGDVVERFLRHAVLDTPRAPECEVLSSARRFPQVIPAVKFNRADGTATVSCEEIEDCVRINVADTGRGISAPNMAKLFVPFERLDVGDTVVEGAGLGLSLSKHLVEAMGGRIGVESVPGEGAAFWVELPLVQGTPATTTRKLGARIPCVAELPRTIAPRTLLSIEDNLSNLRLVERILARRPEVKLVSAMQGSIGLELARQHLPDLILLDLHLPDIQGDEILRQLRADPRTEQLPIMMISADATSAQNRAPPGLRRPRLSHQAARRAPIPRRGRCDRTAPHATGPDLVTNRRPRLQISLPRKSRGA